MGKESGSPLYLILFLAIGLTGAVSFAQELTPRAYWPAPRGTKVATFAYQYSTGDILMDPSLPIVGVDSRINLTQFSYLQTIKLAGRTAQVQLSAPYSWGTTEGVVDGVDRSRYIAGWGDARARLSVNLLGAPTMDGAQFQQLRANPRPIVGASLLVSAPTGGYEPDKLINLGTNRWAIKPAIGYIHPVTRTWLTELEVGMWIFGDNDEFLGSTREQRPIVSGDFHLVKRVRPGFWFSLDLNYYYGGRTTVDGNLIADLQRNSRAGFTLAFPWKRRHAIRGSYSTGAVTSSGGDFDMLTLLYAYAGN
ncbi:MAG: transporter [Thermoanaerobaculia bacterium]